VSGLFTSEVYHSKFGWDKKVYVLEVSKMNEINPIKPLITLPFLNDS
jgi:hypothetical protein